MLQNTRRTHFDYHVVSPFNITPESNIKVKVENKGNDNKLKNLWIVKKILPASTLRNVKNSKENMHTDVRI